MKIPGKYEINPKAFVFMNFVFKIDLLFRFTVYEKTVINQYLLVRLVKPTLGEEKKHYINQTFLFKTNKQTG